MKCSWPHPGFECVTVAISYGENHYTKSTSKHKNKCIYVSLFDDFHLHKTWLQMASTEENKNAVNLLKTEENNIR